MGDVNPAPKISVTVSGSFKNPTTTQKTKKGKVAAGLEGAASAFTPLAGCSDPASQGKVTVLISPDYAKDWSKAAKYVKENYCTEDSPITEEEIQAKLEMANPGAATPKAAVTDLAGKETVYGTLDICAPVPGGVVIETLPSLGKVATVNQNSEVEVTIDVSENKAFPKDFKWENVKVINYCGLEIEAEASGKKLTLKITASKDVEVGLQDIAITTGKDDILKASIKVEEAEKQTKKGGKKKVQPPVAPPKDDTPAEEVVEKKPPTKSKKEL